MGKIELVYKTIRKERPRGKWGSPSMDQNARSCRQRRIVTQEKELSYPERSGGSGIQRGKVRTLVKVEKSGLGEKKGVARGLSCLYRESRGASFLEDRGQGLARSHDWKEGIGVKERVLKAERGSL